MKSLDFSDDDTLDEDDDVDASLVVMTSSGGGPTPFPHAATGLMVARFTTTFVCLNFIRGDIGLFKPLDPVRDWLGARPSPNDEERLRLPDSACEAGLRASREGAGELL